MNVRREPWLGAYGPSVLSYHLGSWMHDLHLLDDGGAVVSDRDTAITGLDHFVHALWAQAGADGVGNCFGGDDVAVAHMLWLCAIFEGALLVGGVGDSGWGCGNLGEGFWS